MGFFDVASPQERQLEELIDKATAESHTTENWELIIGICDRIKLVPNVTKFVLTHIRRRLNHRDPHVTILALSLLDSCWSNCGQQFRREVSSREFISELESKARSSTRQIGEKTRLMLQRWVRMECKEDESLGLVRTLYKNLLADGLSFDEPNKRPALSNDPNVVQSQEEEDAIAKAIALSLKDCPKENGNSGASSSTNHRSAGGSVYPAMENGNNGTRWRTPSSSTSRASLKPLPSAPSPTASVCRDAYADAPASASPSARPRVVRAYLSDSSTTVVPRTLSFNRGPRRRAQRGVNDEEDLEDSTVVEDGRRKTMGIAPPSARQPSTKSVALFDFEDVEENELPFRIGDVIMVIDDTNASWWRGINDRTGAEGLFPSSFVTTNPEEMAGVKSDLLPSDPSLPTSTVTVARIDEDQLLRCIAMLEDCDPSGTVPDPPELPALEAAAMAQGPLIDAALASVDKQSNELASVDMAIRNVLALYDAAVQQASAYAATRYAVASASLPQAGGQGPHPQAMAGPPPQVPVHHPQQSSLPAQPQPALQQQYMQPAPPQGPPPMMQQYVPPQPDWSQHQAHLQQQHQQYAAMQQPQQ